MPCHLHYCNTISNSAMRCMCIVCTLHDQALSAQCIAGHALLQAPTCQQGMREQSRHARAEQACASRAGMHSIDASYNILKFQHPFQVLHAMVSTSVSIVCKTCVGKVMTLNSKFLYFQALAEKATEPSCALQQTKHCCTEQSST